MDRRDFLRLTGGTALGALLLPAIPLAGISGACRTVNAAPPDSFTGEDVFERLIGLADKNNWKALPIGEIMGQVALSLRGTPYVGGTLDTLVDTEVCSVNMKGLDCVTLFETALNFARMLKKGGRTPAELTEHVTYTRYRDGQLKDYTSRLHYTTDWFYDNQEKRVVNVITRELPGAQRFTETVNFMSTHTDSYKQLKAHPELVPKIVETERIINGRTMHYVPKAKVAAIESKLRTGDIVGITTTIKGIDCSHTGLCYRDAAGVLRYIHASSTKKMVILDESLSTYLDSVSKHTGIMVARPIEV